jgi:hypothetical protein
MKPLPPPPVPGQSDWERFDNAVKIVLNVSKEDLKKEETKASEPKAKRKPTK